MTLTFNFIQYFLKNEPTFILCELQISRTCSQKYFCYTLYIIHNADSIAIFLALVFYVLKIMIHCHVIPTQVECSYFETENVIRINW